MEVCKTDIQEAIRHLEYCRNFLLLSPDSRKPKIVNKIRLMNKLTNKLKSKLL